MENVINVNDNGQVVLAYLKTNVDGAIGAVISEATGVSTARGIHGVINPMFNNKLVSKEVIKVAALDKDGNPTQKDATLYFITDLGAAWTAPVVEAV